MSLTAFVSSSLPFQNGGYTVVGLQTVPVVINVYNNNPSSSVTLKTIYLTQDDDALLLGDPNFKQRGVSFSPANNVVPAATVIESSGSVPIPSGSGDSSVWIALPLQTSSLYTVGSPPLELGPFIQNLGFYGIDNTSNPPFLLPVYPSTNNSSIINVGPTPIFSGAVNLTQALNFTSSVYDYDPNVSQGALFGQLANFGVDPPTSSLANEFTYEWWSNLRSYGVPDTGYVQPTTNAGAVWKTFGFPFLEGAGALIGYLESGELFIMMDEDFQAPFPHPPVVGLSSSATVPLSTWVHQAVTRNGAGQVTFWIDGTGSGGGTRAIAQNAHYVNNFYLFGDNLSIPYLSDDGNSPYEGLISNTSDGYFMNMEFSNVCKYTGNFIPPTSSLSAAYGGGGGNIPVTSSQTIPGSASYSALFTPQVDPLAYVQPELFYSFDVGARVMRGNNPNITIATASLFRVTALGDIPNSTVSIENPYAVWSLADNKRPPQNDGFDFQLTTQVFLGNTGQLLQFPQSLLFYSSSDPGVVEVIENSDGFEATTGSVGGFTQLTASGGSVIVKGTGSATIYLGLGSPPQYPGNYQGETSITVVDALPVAITINPAIRNVFSSSSYPYKATLLKSNGLTEDITSTATWSTAGAEATLTLVGSTQELGVTGSFGTITLNAVSGGLSATSQATIISRNF